MLDNLQRWLDERMAQVSKGGLELEVVLEELLVKWPPLSIVEDLLSDHLGLEEVRRRSYHHANGFDRIELIAGQRPEYGLRIHAWWGEVSGEKERVHGHPWNFASVVLAGLLRVEQFVVSQSGEPVEVLHYARPTNEGDYTLAPAGICHIRPILRIGLLPGVLYGVQHEFLHRVWTDRGRDTITLMLHGEGIAYPSCVFRSNEDEQRSSERHTKQEIAPAQLMACIQRIHSRVKAETETSPCCASKPQ